jgi:hypothetical protein
LSGLGRTKDAEKWAKLAARAEKEFDKVGDSLEVLEEIEIPVRRERVEGDFEAERPRRGGERPRRDGERPARDGDRPKREGGERPRRSEGERPKRDGERPRRTDATKKPFRKNDSDQRRTDGRPGKRQGRA